VKDRTIRDSIYEGTWEARQRHVRYNHSEKGHARVLRYEASPRRKAGRIALRRYGLSLRQIEDDLLLGLYPDIGEALNGGVSL
jgi:hypothetical protein